MATSSVASEADRLPWLTDEPKRRKGVPIWVRGLLGFIGLGLVAALFYWVGMNASLRERQEQAAEAPAEVRVPVPPPVAADEPALTPQAMPEVSPAPVPAPVALPPQVEIRPDTRVAPPARTAARNRAPARRSSAPPAKAAPSKKAAAQAERLSFANPWESADASGRMVRVGTYSSLQQGKSAWSRLARVFPAMRRLPAVVTDIPSLRNGRTYYRLQIGTTSQAHSEVLCQRMKAIGQSCVVVDLAGARGKGSWDDGQPVGL